MAISNILLTSSIIDSDGNGTLEKDEFTMLCLRVMRWPIHDVDKRIQRMVPKGTEEQHNLLKFFFSHMNRWFMRKLNMLRSSESSESLGGHLLDPAEEHSIREAEKVNDISSSPSSFHGEYKTWENPNPV